MCVAMLSKVQLDNDQEKAQSEKDSHSKNLGIFIKPANHVNGVHAGLPPGKSLSVICL